MLTERDFLDLLSMPEGEALDFKSTSYPLSHGDDSGLTLVKDVICMANTPRDKSAFIITGVRRSADGVSELLGVDTHPDDSLLQQQFTDRVHPVPRFAYYPLACDGRSFGVIEILPDRLGPCVPRRDFGKFLRQQQVYFRRGSTNDLAYPEDLQKILGWVNGSAQASAVHDDIPAWEQFQIAVHRFDPLYRFALLASPLRNFGSSLSPLSRVPWTYVFDFDPDSETLGLLAAVEKELRQARGLHLLVRGEEAQIGVLRSTFWFFPLGLRGRSETIIERSWKDWKVYYGQEIDRQVNSLAKAVLPSPLVCIVLWQGNDLLRHLDSTLENLLSLFGSQIEFVFVSDERIALQSTSQAFHGSYISIDLSQLCSGISLFLQEREATNEDIIALPSKSGAPIKIDKPDLAWLTEDCDLVHLNAGTVRPPNRAIGRAFLQGDEIDWYELGLGSDIDRTLRERIERQVRLDLRAGRTVRLNLFHSPGAGGSTIARRVAWNLHFSYPCVILRRSVGDETAERLYRIASRTAQAVLVVSESSDISDRESEQLFDALRSRQIPVVFLQVQRRFSPTETRERSFFLPATLDSVEVRRFVDMFSQIAPSKRAKLQEVATTTETKQKTAFYFGLTAFGRDFRGLSSYVNNRINEVEPSAKRMLVYLSLVHHYAQRAIPVDLFAKLVGTHPVRLDVALPTGSLELLLEEKHGHWRTIHELIALEIIEQLLAPAGSDRRLWKQLVSQRAIEFMELCSASDGPVGEEPLEILRRMFVYRDSSNIIGSEVAAINKFSHLLEDIPARDGRLRVLQELVRQCPDEPHFLAHLGRFYSIEMRDPIRALECLDKAIALQPTDHLLHHMKGMVFRKEMEQLIMEREKLEAVTLSAKAARESFERARVLEPDDEHGYISEVQVIAKLMDYAGRSSQRGSFSYLKGESVDPAMRELLEKAEDLLEQVRRNREGDRASLFEVECRAKLDALYGDHERALQAWDGLLAQPGTYRPPLRRQIIRTYLARHERTWSKLSPKEVKRSLQLLNDNLEEDPYNDRDLRLWLQAARYAPAPLPIETAIERVAYWKTKSGALDAVYYLYVLHTILALEGSKLHRDEGELFMAECRQIARGRRNRTKSFEWVGKGAGLLALVHQAELGEWKEDLDFWSSTERLKRLDGRISKIEAPQSGEIELDGGVFAFFVPAGRVGRGEFSKGRHENAAISCFVGFSYDGLRAWDVRSREKPA